MGRLLYHIDKVFIVVKICYFLLQIVDGAIEITCTLSESVKVRQHVQSLIAACLVVQDNYDEISVDLTAIRRDEF